LQSWSLTLNQLVSTVALQLDTALPALGRSKTEIARLLGISRQTLYDILNEKQPITAQMALRIGKLCGNGGEFWLRLQTRYDMQMAEAEIGDKLDAIPLLKAA
jgi:antitoxin HigA-1